ncbi:MAG TPA: 6-phosphogluconolactonase [Candidatus Paceibacterota bacterium]|nr:6-phosphogluconolactonase [Candidatus Paceibacterota bacterium]HMP18886.1 6-phosphogluconolactonase [Candidatus Paceibacterota bacterium]HMP85047.1 6-phosphogluconolactonase [Candidatus Paceibacterota bacterium]
MKKESAIIRNKNDFAKIIKNNFDFLFSKTEKINLGLCGGNSIIPILKILTKTKVNWPKINIFLTDERWVKSDHEESNFLIIKKYLIEKINIPKENINYFDIEKGLAEYNKKFKKNGNRLDFIFFGVGEDGHIASLFPHQKSLTNKSNKYIKIHNSPKPPKTRISLSPNVIKNSKFSVALFFGTSKKNSLENFLSSKITTNQCPAKIIKSSKKYFVFTDLK